MNKTFPFILILITLLFSCAKSEDKTKNKKQLSLKWVTVNTVGTHHLQSQIVITGQVKPNRTSIVKSPVNGIVKKLNFKENDKIKKGDVIAEIVPLEKILLLAKYRDKLNKLKKSFVDSIHNKALRIEEQIKFAQKMYQNTTIASEMNGLISNRNIDEGSEINTKDVLIELTDPSSYVIKAAINESYFSKIKKGMQLNLRLMAYPNQIFKGNVNLIYPRVNTQMHSILFDIRLNKKIELLEGMQANIYLVTDSRNEVLAIPEDAILQDSKNNPFVFIVDKENKVHHHPIKTGLYSEGLVEILEGLKENDKIVVKGQNTLKEGLKVKLTNVRKS